ncbi:hypothetical protein LINGRAHAP2_LOCUS22123 [Linum grandiflorum]
MEGGGLGAGTKPIVDDVSAEEEARIATVTKFNSLRSDKVEEVSSLMAGGWLLRAGKKPIVIDDLTAEEEARIAKVTEQFLESFDDWREKPDNVAAIRNYLLIGIKNIRDGKKISTSAPKEEKIFPPARRRKVVRSLEEEAKLAKLIKEIKAKAPKIEYKPDAWTLRFCYC